MNGRRMMAVVLVLTITLFAMGCRQEVTEKDRLASNNYYRLSVSYYNQGKAIETLRNLQEAEKFNPNNPDVHYMYGIVYLGKKMYDRAESSFAKTIELNPEHSDAYVGLASVYMDTNRWQDAIDKLGVPEKDIMYPRKDVVFDNLGWCYHQLGDSQRGADYLKMATIENPKNCHAYYNLGRVLRDLTRHQEAIAAFEKSIEYCPNFFFGYYELALSAIKGHDSLKAKPALKKCIELGGEREEVGECRNYFKLLKQ